MKKETGFFISSDKTTEIAYYIYSPETPVAIIQISHGMCEYIERYESHAQRFTEQGFILCGNDHKGHGNSAKASDELGYTGSADTLVDDVHLMTELVREKYPDLPVILLGHSMGSFVAREYMSRYHGSADAFIIIGTAGPENPTSLGKLVCKLVGAFKGERHRSKLLFLLANGSYDKHFKKENRCAWLTHDTEITERYTKDPFCAFIFTVNGYYNMFDLLSRVSKKTWADTVEKDKPILIISGDEDPVGNFGEGVRKVFSRIVGAEVSSVRCEIYEGGRHELFNESPEIKEKAFSDVIDFVNEVKEKFVSGGTEA